MSYLRPLATLLLAIFMVMAGSGALPAVIGIRLGEAGYSAPLIGLLGTGYFAGLTIGSIATFRIISGVGHIRAFAAFVSVFSASALAYSLDQNLPFWLLLRVVNGFCIAGTFVCLESWLNDRADADKRGATLAFYMIALYGGQTVSQLLLWLEPGNPRLPFVVASIILSLTVVPVALTRMDAPSIGVQERLKLSALYKASPLGLIGSISTGLMLGAFYTMAPIHAQRIGMSNLEIAWLIGSVIAGGMALQWPLGWLSDRFERRSVIVASLAATFAICAGMVLLQSTTAIVGLGIAFGGFVFALYPMLVAHANDHISVNERMGASSGLILAYSVGAAIGPMASAFTMSVFDASGLYLFIGATAFATFLFGVWRQIVSLPVPTDLQRPFHILPRTSPMAAQLDPEVAAEPPIGMHGNDPS